MARIPLSLGRGLPARAARAARSALGAAALVSTIGACRPAVRPETAASRQESVPTRARGLDSAAATRRGDALCVVVRVVDGDTFNCADGQRVRLIGIDAPELKQRPFGQRARQALARLAPVGDTVTLELDVSRRDRYGRTLAYVWRVDTLVNEALVRQGYALLYTVPPDVRYAERIERAQRRARTERAGLWADDGFACEPREARQGKCK